MQQAPARHKKWNRDSQSCTQAEERRSVRVLSNTVGPVAVSELASAAHAAGAHAPDQQQQYSRRSRYCLQLKACGGGPEPAQAAHMVAHRAQAEAPQGATSALIAVAVQRPSIPCLPAKHAVPVPTAAVRPGHRVYVRGTVQQQPQQQSTETLQASLRRQHHGVIGAGAGTAGDPTAVTVPTPTAFVSANGDMQSTQLHGITSGRLLQQHNIAGKAPVTPMVGQQVARAMIPQQQQQANQQCGASQGQLHNRQQHQVQQQQQQQQTTAAPVAGQQGDQTIQQQSALRRPSQQQQKLQQRRQPFTKRWLSGPKQLITCAAANGNVKLVYKRHRHKLERTGVRAAVAGASLSWIRESASPHLAAAAQAAVAAAAGAAAAKHAERKERLKQAQQRQHHRRQQLLIRRQAVAAAAANGAPGAAGVHKMHAKWLTPGFKLIRIGGQLYYSTPKGLCSAAAAKLLAKRTSATSSAAQPNARGTAAAAGLGVQKIIQKPFSSSSSSSSKLASQQRPAVPAAPAGMANRLLSSTAVARSLAVARGRNAAKRAAVRRGICLHYCKHGKCDLALRGQCEKVHDPSKVAVCQQWLVGKCSNADCKLQHQVVPELMPVCMYFLEGVCSNRDCPYLHVKVAADAPACRAFLQGYCPAGAACPHKHLTLRMLKQQQQKQQGQQQQQGVKRRKQHTGARAQHRYVRPVAAAAVTIGEGSGVTGKQPQVLVAAAAGEGRVGVIESRCSVGMVLEQLLPQAEGGH